MKKVIKNYLAKLQENDKKGFSLVELIIVMAIMAILVGVVASQVLPYMEKSRQSKDQQVLSSICTDVVSSVAQATSDVGEFTCKVDDLTASSKGATGTDHTGAVADIQLVGAQFEELHGATTSTGLKLKSSAANAKGKDGEDKAVMVKYTKSSGKGTVEVYVDGHQGKNDKLTVVSD